MAHTNGPLALTENWAVSTSGAIQDWPALRQAAHDGYSDRIMCLATIEIVERSNRATVIKPINDANAGRAATILRDSALVRMHLYLVRAFAPVSRPDDIHLRAGIDFLRDHLREEPNSQRRSDLCEAIRLFDAADAAPCLATLRHMRNKMLAHWAVPDATVRLPHYDELFEFARQTCAIWERLSFGAGTDMYPISSQVKAYRESADAFWARWES